MIFSAFNAHSVIRGASMDVKALNELLHGQFVVENDQMWPNF